MRVLVLGAGGHGQVVTDILLRMHENGSPLEPVGYLDDNPTLLGRRLLNLPVLGTIADLPAIVHQGVIVAIGDNTLRRHHFEALQAQGECLVTACHPRSTIAPDVHMGPGCMICAGVVVNSGSAIGANAILNTGCTVDHHNRIGNHVHVAPGVHLGGDVTVGEGAMIGIGATVIPQREIGAWTEVGAGSVVTKDAPPHVAVVGMPARVMRRIGTDVVKADGTQY
jgi:sugar O-acyltransferase (sialic acid O-acetyltransferase NeuD family)